MKILIKIGMFGQNQEKLDKMEKVGMYGVYWTCIYMYDYIILVSLYDQQEIYFEILHLLYLIR